MLPLSKINLRKLKNTGNETISTHKFQFATYHYHGLFFFLYSWVSYLQIYFAWPLKTGDGQNVVIQQVNRTGDCGIQKTEILVPSPLLLPYLWLPTLLSHQQSSKGKECNKIKKAGVLLATHYHLELVELVRGSMREARKACALEENESHSYTYCHVVSMCVGGHARQNFRSTKPRHTVALIFCPSVS